MQLGCGYLLILRCLLYFLALANLQKSAYLLIEYITGSPKSWQEWGINKRRCVKFFWTKPSASESTFFKNSRVISSSNVPDIKYTCLLSKQTKREQNEMMDVRELFCNKQPRIGFVYVLKYGKANMKFITVQNALCKGWRKRRCWGGHLWDLGCFLFPWLWPKGGLHCVQGKSCSFANTNSHGNLRGPSRSLCKQSAAKELPRVQITGWSVIRVCRERKWELFK